MNNFQISLDKYLTTDHDTDRWISFYEKVAEKHSDEFYDNNEEWFTHSDQYDNLLDKAYQSGFSPEYSAKLIERLHSLYKL